MTRDEDANEDDSTEWVAVCTPLDMNQLVFVKSLLQSEDIPFFVKGEGLNNLYAPLRTNVMTVLVPSEHADDASELLKDLT